MNTNAPSSDWAKTASDYLGSLSSLCEDVAKYIAGASSGVLLFIALLGLGAILKRVRKLSNEWIPWILLPVALTGSVTMLPLDPSQVSPYVAYPGARLWFVGLAYWIIAWCVHRWVLKFLMAKLREKFPALGALLDKGDTVFFKRGDVPPPTEPKP